jgi:hypothetical protein
MLVGFVKPIIIAYHEEACLFYHLLGQHKHLQRNLLHILRRQLLLITRNIT